MFGENSKFQKKYEISENMLFGLSRSAQLREMLSNLVHQDKHLPMVLPIATAGEKGVAGCTEGGRKA